MVEAKLPPTAPRVPLGMVWWRPRLSMPQCAPTRAWCCRARTRPHPRRVVDGGKAAGKAVGDDYYDQAVNLEVPTGRRDERERSAGGERLLGQRKVRAARANPDEAAAGSELEALARAVEAAPRPRDEPVGGPPPHPDRQPAPFAPQHGTAVGLRRHALSAAPIPPRDQASASCRRSSSAPTRSSLRARQVRRPTRFHSRPIRCNIGRPPTQAARRAGHPRTPGARA